MVGDAKRFGKLSRERLNPSEMISCGLRNAVAVQPVGTVGVILSHDGWLSDGTEDPFDGGGFREPRIRRPRTGWRLDTNVH